MNEVIFLGCNDIVLSDNFDAMVSFPEGWVHMRLEGTMGIPDIFIVATYAGNKQTIRLEEGKSFKIHGRKVLCCDQSPSITVKHVRTEDRPDGQYVFLKGGPPADLL